MSLLLIDLMRRYWLQIMAGIAVTGLMAFAGIQHVRLKIEAVKLQTAATLHLQDEQRIAALGKSLADQNDAITAMQAAQTQKEQIVEKALVVARVQEKKVATLLAPTDNKKLVSCDDAMPDVRTILKGLTR